MRTLFVFVLFVVISLAAAECVRSCKSIHVKDIPGCDLSGKGCKCIFETKYKIELKDPVSGVSAQSSYFHSQTAAGDDAVYKLFINDTGCNCNLNTSKMGQCTVNTKVCMFWVSDAAVANKQTSFRIFMQAVLPTVTQNFEQVAANASDIPAALEAVATDVVKANPMCNPVGYFSQKKCTDAACTAGCASYNFNIGLCLKLSDGGYAINTCNSTALTLTKFSTSTCTGAPTGVNVMPVGKCLKDGTTYFENICHSALDGSEEEAAFTDVGTEVFIPRF